MAVYHGFIEWAVAARHEHVPNRAGPNEHDEADRIVVVSTVISIGGGWGYVEGEEETERPAVECSCERASKALRNNRKPNLCPVVDSTIC